MDIHDIATVSGDTSVAEAFARLIQSGRSAVLVMTDNGQRLHFAETLHTQMRKDANLPVIKLAQTPEEELIMAGGYSLVGTQEGRASFRVSSMMLFDKMNLVMVMHYCHAVPQQHAYYDWELPKLQKKNGNYICNFDPTIVT